MVVMTIEEVKKLKKKKIKAKYTWKDIEGSIKGGKRSSPEEIEEVLLQSIY